jgi:hypothetical protein
LLLDFAHDIDDISMVSHMIYNIKSPMYQVLLTVIKREISSGSEVALADLKRDMRQVYAQYALNKTFKKDKEMVLSVVPGKAKFQDGFQR